VTDSFANLHPIVADLLRRGMADARASRRDYARRAFEQALALDPECGEAMLWLAALAPDGETSLHYLARALELNPRDPRAHAGIRWARKRLKAPPPGETRPSPPPARRPADEIQPSPRVDRAPAAASERGRRTSPRWRWAVAAALVVCVALAGSVALIDAIGADRVSAAIAPLMGWVTPTATASPLPLRPSPTPTPTHTNTSTPTETPTPTDTPTDTPSPTPTQTPIPPTATRYVPPPTAAIPPSGGNPAERWIDISLSTQSITAYEGSTPVRTFIVSTGLPNTPTVTGQFRIYLRYDSQTMSGPGYYLPGVQWVQYFYSGYALHGTYWHNNFGQPMSHGCVNMTNADALWMYQWADYGTVVNVHY